MVPLRRLIPRLSARRLLRDARGAAVIWVALSLPPLLAATGVALNVGQAGLARQRVQMAADLGAQAGAISYARDSNAQVAANVAADVAQLNGVATDARSWNAGSKTLTAGPLSIVVGNGVTDVTRTAITVNASRTVNMAFSGVLDHVASRTISATSTAEVWTPSGIGGSGGGACVLATSTNAAMAIRVDNMGKIQTSGCAIQANSTAAGTGTGAAIYLNSGTISGSAIKTPGKVCMSNSGSNTMSPNIAGSGARCNAPGSTAAADPYAALAIPSPTQTGCAVNTTYGVCCIPPITGTVSGVSSSATNVVNQSYTAWQSTPRTFNPANGGVFCGNTTIGGNGTNDQFAPGIYYVVNGNLTFNNSAVVSATGVSFVLIGKNGGNPGGISWTNYSNTYVLAAPATGPTANILFWQTCKADGTAPDNNMAGGSTLTMTGSFYAKCGALNLSNNIQMNAATGATMQVIAKTIYAAGSAGINAAGAAASPVVASTALVR
jgi:Flp pilus assembly protein TadG